MVTLTTKEVSYLQGGRSLRDQDLRKMGREVARTRLGTSLMEWLVTRAQPRSCYSRKSVLSPFPAILLPSEVW